MTPQLRRISLLPWMEFRGVLLSVRVYDDVADLELTSDSSYKLSIPHRQLIGRSILNKLPQKIAILRTDQQYYLIPNYLDPELR